MTKRIGEEAVCCLGEWNQVKRKPYNFPATTVPTATATATTTTTTIGSGAAESGQLVELDVAASEAAALSLPSLVDPIPKRFLRWEDGIDDEDEDEKGKECASPIAMSPEEIDRCEAIKEGLRLQEAAEECSVDKLRAILGKCLVYESIKRGYNKG